MNGVAALERRMVTARTGVLISPYTACGKPVYNGRAVWTDCGRRRLWVTEPAGCGGQRDERWG